MGDLNGKPLYRENLSLLTDFYQLTMAYAAWKTGGDKKEGVFDLYFRKNPFAGAYAINCGLDAVLDFVENFHFDAVEVDYLATLRGADGKPLFEPAFTEYLRTLKLAVDIDAIEEGRVVFAGEPLYRVRGPILQCQLLETALLNLVNFATLVATKACRVKDAAGSDPVLEFGLRRAQGIDGGLTASRACYVGGADATSNVLAGKLYQIPVRGTHAHSWVMSFDDELEAFMKFAEAMPNNAIFLVDTYDTLEGVRNAIRAGEWLQSKGHRMLGIRLDSGDLAYLSIEARKLLDAAGFTDAVIVASNDLDESIISSLKQQGARINVWGVGTKLVTAYDQPALGGVFKLVAMKEVGGEYEDRIKLSEQLVKITNPGIHQVRRYFKDEYMAGDMIYDARHTPQDEQVMIDPQDPTRRKNFSAQDRCEDLLVPVVKAGRVTYPRPTLEQIRQRREKDVARLHPTTRRLTFPHTYPVGLAADLHAKKSALILKLRGVKSEDRL